MCGDTKVIKSLYISDFSDIVDCSAKFDVVLDNIAEVKKDAYNSLIFICCDFGVIILVAIYRHFFVVEYVVAAAKRNVASNVN